MKTFKSWFLLLFFWALVAIALVVGAPAHAQVAAGTSASSSSSSTTTTTTTATQAVAPQILQLPTVAYQAPLMDPVCPTFGAPLGYGYGRSFGAGFGYGRTFGAGFGYGHSVGFRRGFAAPVYGGVGFAAVPSVSNVRVNVVTPAARVRVAAPRRQVIRQKTVIRAR